MLYANRTRSRTRTAVRRTFRRTVHRMRKRTTSPAVFYGLCHRPDLVPLGVDHPRSVGTNPTLWPKSCARRHKWGFDLCRWAPTAQERSRSCAIGASRPLWRSLCRLLRYVKRGRVKMNGCRTQRGATFSLNNGATVVQHLPQTGASTVGIFVR